MKPAGCGYGAVNGELVRLSDVRKQIVTMLERYSQELDGESKKAVQHYIQHDEYEMAFEGLA